MFKNNYLYFLIFLNWFCYVFGYYKYYDTNSPCRDPILKTRGICKSYETCNSSKELQYYYGITPAQCYSSNEVCCIYPLSGSVKNVQQRRISAEKCSSNRIHEDRNIYRPAQYLAHWRIKEMGRPTTNCAGALISPFFILTSAKCTVTDREYIGEIYLGGSRLTDIVYPEQLLPYASYDNMTLYHDIGLIKLTAPVKYNFINGYPCLWQTDAIYSEKLTIFDIEYNRISNLYYRYRREPYTKFDGLKYKFTLFKNDPCKKFEVISEHGLYKPNQKHMNDYKLCLENFKPETADCNTINSGTPITAKIWNKVYIVGVASEVECKNGHLMRHTRVSSYLNWIEHIVWNNGYVSRGYRE